MNKYHNRKTEINGITFDSAAEARRYMQLRGMEHTGIIHNLRLQPRFLLVKSNVTPSGKKIRPVEYRADFAYEDADGTLIVEDVKGFKTRAYEIKKKLMLDRFGIEIREIHC